MPRYAAIDLLTNYVWGVTDAANAIDACRDIDAEYREFDYEYEIIPVALNVPRRPNRKGYLVYKVPDGFGVRDGTDPAEIRTVKSSTFEALVERRN